MNQETKDLQIAVLGQSASGKSAFIRSFSAEAEYISSSGEGQTTRFYVEYRFHTEGEGQTLVKARLKKEREFVEFMADQTLRKLESGEDDTEINIAGVQEKLKKGVYSEQTKIWMLHSKEIFDISELYYLDPSLEFWEEEMYRRFLKKMETPGNDTLEQIMEDFFMKVYSHLLQVLEKYYKGKDCFQGLKEEDCFRFVLTEETKGLLEYLLKVGEKGSLTGILSLVRLEGRMDGCYSEIAKKLGINSVTLVDTCGLDHAEAMENKMLRNQYRRIFKGYSCIDAVFFTERLTVGSPEDFKRALTTLYQVKPDVMAYVVGTFIDSNEDGVKNCQSWLYSTDKADEKDKVKNLSLKGKVWEYLCGRELEIALMECGVSDSMANMRCKVMKNRFAPFCGEIPKEGEVDYRRANCISVESLLRSVVSREHFGTRKIPVDKVEQGISDKNTLQGFACYFLESVTENFKDIYKDTASRTRGKIRSNLENYVLGFDSFAVNATWRRAMQDALNRTFTRKAPIEGEEKMLSDVLGLEGNGKEAFDEIMTSVPEILLRRVCRKEEKIWGTWEVDGRDCFDCMGGKDTCLWSLLVNAVGKQRFQEYDSNRYGRVIDWLLDMHKFSNYKGLQESVTDLFAKVLAEEVLPLCQEHNRKVEREDTV